jgi:hypothetical protein
MAWLCDRIVLRFTAEAGSAGQNGNVRNGDRFQS